MSAATLDQDILDTMTPEELAAINDPEHSEAELEAMRRIADDDGDDDGDDDDPSAPPVEGKDAPPAAENKPAAPAAAATTNTDPAPAKPAASAAVEEPAMPPSAVTATYDAKLPSDYDDQVKTLATQEADLKAKFKSGEIDFDEFELQRGELLTRRDELNQARIKAEISQEMTQQTAQNQWKSTVDRFVMSAAKEEGGIDYRKDLSKQADLDQFVRVLASRDENSDKPMDWFLTEAHKRVKALHGVADVAPAPKADPAAAAKAANEGRKPPVAAMPATLAQVPGGDGPGDVAGEFADIDALEGDALESAIAKMTPAQREKWARGR
jgi:hypothetical protein